MFRLRTHALARVVPLPRDGQRCRQAWREDLGAPKVNLEVSHTQTYLQSTTRKTAEVEIDEGSEVEGNQHNQENGALINAGILIRAFRDLGQLF